MLLARTLTPEPMRPGRVEALAMSRSVLPYQRLLTIDERSYESSEAFMVSDSSSQRGRPAPFRVLPPIRSAHINS